jgi:D-glycero-alpha-D-manno-heptose 1-phosphate guanylyltransferase
MLRVDYMTSPNFEESTILILAGGFGSRLRPIISDRPKVLADINGRFIITYLFDQIIRSGGKDIILCTGFESHQVEIALGNKYQSLNLSYSKESKSLGTAGALRNANGLVTSDTVVVLNGDSYCDVAITDVWQWHHSKGALCTIVVVHMHDISRYGHVKYDHHNIVTAFEEKGVSLGEGWINAGIYIIDQQLITNIPDDAFISIEKDIFPSIIGDGLYAYPAQGSFIDIGTPESYAKAADFFHKENM